LLQLSFRKLAVWKFPDVLSAAYMGVRLLSCIGHTMLEADHTVSERVCMESVMSGWHAVSKADAVCGAIRSCRDTIVTGE
jgi:hypothetical protein